MPKVVLRAIKVRKWAMIGKADLDFSSRVTIIAGHNGAGKTTILRLLAFHANWKFPELRIEENTSKENGVTEFGRFEYDDGSIAKLERGPRKKGIAHSIFVRHAKKFPCIYIPSHLSAPAYASIDSVSVVPRSPREALSAVDKALQDDAFGRSRQHNAMHEIKRTLVEWSNSSQVDAQRFMVRLVENLKQILPQEVRFRSLSAEGNELMILTKGSKFSFDSLSGGLASIFLMAWELTAFEATLRGEPGLAIIDEPENHLHAEMQRRLLPSLVATFPTVRFLVATHSPLVVASIRDQRVYVLRFEEGTRSIARELADFETAGTAADTLRDALGVSFSGPIWAEQELARVLSELQRAPLDLGRLSHELERSGLARWALSEVLDEVGRRG